VIDQSHVLDGGALIDLQAELLQRRRIAAELAVFAISSMDDAPKSTATSSRRSAMSVNSCSRCRCWPSMMARATKWPPAAKMATLAATVAMDERLGRWSFIECAQVTQNRLHK